MTFDAFVDTFETVVAKRPGIYGQNTEVREVIGPDAVGPKTFAKILITRLELTQEHIMSVDFQDGASPFWNSLMHYLNEVIFEPSTGP